MLGSYCTTLQADRGLWTGLLWYSAVGFDRVCRETKQCVTVRATSVLATRLMRHGLVERCGLVWSLAASVCL